MPYSYILASQSPRRRQLLHEAGFSFEIIASAADESFPDDMPPAEVPLFLAQQKAQQLVANHPIPPDAIVIAADTVVVINDLILNKPTDEFDAQWMLRQLSGQRHEVITGVCLLSANQIHTFSAKTAVYFKPLSYDQIHYYIDHYHPFDKAGAYAIQEWIGLVGIERIEGCYFNVVGLPISLLCSELERFEDKLSS